MSLPLSHKILIVTAFIVILGLWAWVWTSFVTFLPKDTAAVLGAVMLAFGVGFLLGDRFGDSAKRVRDLQSMRDRPDV